ncbi:MAG: putative 2OG-Fe(II) oxygenase [Lysobacter sp.]
MSLRIHSAFAVPFAELQHPDCASLNSDLRSLILGLASKGNEYRNVDAAVHQPMGLFESRFEFFARPEQAVQQLRIFCWAALGDFIRELNTALADGTDGLRISSQTWFHVTRNGGHFGYHNHPMASWSGVYCVANGNPDPAVSNNGSLIFPHPLSAANSYLDIANSTMKWPYSQGNLVMDLSPGQLILFPSWLGHYVSPFQGTAPRITVAFNVWFNKEE